MISHQKATPVAILGSGLIGTDLLLKIQRSELLECKLFIGRSLNSPGLAKASSLGVPISDKSIDAIRIPARLYLTPRRPVIICATGQFSNGSGSASLT